jgi:hypothetical protein
MIFNFVKVMEIIELKKSSSFFYLSFMPVRRAITEKEGVYFITFTCTSWLPLFKIYNDYDAVYDWFNNLKEQGHYIIGYFLCSFGSPGPPESPQR